MRIFLIEWSTDILFETAKQLQAKGMEIVYWTSANGQERIKQDFPHAIYHNTFEAVKGLPAANVDVSLFEPLSVSLLGKLNECETQALLMMQRFCFADNLSGLGFAKRQAIYFSYVKYWAGVLRLLKPDVVFFVETPHMVFDFIAYHLCKVFGIKTLMFEITRVPCRVLLLDDFQKSHPDFEKLLADTVSVTLNDLTKETKEYYQKMIQPGKLYYPFFHAIDQQEAKYFYLPKLSSILVSIQRRNFFNKVRVYFFRLRIFLKSVRAVRTFLQRKKFRQNLKKEYLSLEKPADLAKNFIFFPLQFQPERTTSPLAGVFAHQYLIVDILSKAIPAGWEIYIKEHPRQFLKSKGYRGRYHGFYQELAKYPNVRLVPFSFSSNDLIQKCRAVATATGTAGWEAPLKGKPSLVFGFASYSFCEGVFRISNFNDCCLAIQKIINGYRPDPQKVLNFLAVLDKIAIKAYLGTNYEKDLNLSAQTASRNITSRILLELKKPIS